MTAHDDTAHADTATEPREQARTIASETSDVRERVRRSVVNTMRSRKLGLGSISDVTRDVIDGAVEGVKDLTPDEQDSVLRQVVDGLGDAFSSTANATRLAMEEAAGRGERFAKEDVDSAIKHLSELQRVFTETVSNTFDRARVELSAQTRDFIEHARRAAERARPSIESALRAATSHPVKLATETASAGVRGAPKAAGMLLYAVSGVLQGAGDLITGAGKSSSDDKQQ